MFHILFRLVIFACTAYFLKMKITYFGHACFLAEINGKNILFDPFITGNELAANIQISSIKADYIFVSHGHGDHIADAVAIAQANDATVVGVYEVTAWFNAQGVSKTHPMNTGGKWNFDFGTVKCVNAVHSSALPDGSYGGNPVGFVFTTKEGNFYYSGDTALTTDMQLIPSYAKLDLAILPIGDNFTMDVADASAAAKMVQCNKVLGVHYDTFGYIKIDQQKAKDLFKQNGQELVLMQIGQTENL